MEFWQLEPPDDPMRILKRQVRAVLGALYILEPPDDPMRILKHPFCNQAVSGFVT